MGSIGTAVTFGVFFTLWWVTSMLAYFERFDTVEAMQSHGLGFERGIPFDGHVAMKYLDQWPFPILMALWVGLCGDQWDMLEACWMGWAGFAISAVMHYSYIEAGKKFPEVVTYGGKLTMAGGVHVIYMGLGFAIVGLGYFCTPHPVPWLVWTSSVYLVVHVTLGVHVIHKIWAPAWFPYHGVMDSGTLVPIIAATAMLGGMTWWALS